MASTVSSDLGKSVQSDRSDIIYLKEKRERGKERRKCQQAVAEAHIKQTQKRSVARVRFPASHVSHFELVRKEKKSKTKKYFPNVVYQSEQLIPQRERSCT